MRASGRTAMATLEKFKLSALTYDYDKDPKGFFIWIESMGGFVRSTEGGPDLEDMLDSKLHRKPDVGKMIPSFLQDPDFDPEPGRLVSPAEKGDTVSATIATSIRTEKNIVGPKSMMRATS